MPPQLRSAERLYTEFADWWPLLSAPEDYAEEAALYTKLLADACSIAPRTLLELGSGGGNNASFMKSRFECTLVDRSDGMLGVSKSLNPECEHVRGDMRTVRLDRTFDCVFIHDAVCYMTSPEDLQKAIHTAFTHCNPGGSALFAPDHVLENFRESTGTGGHDGNGRSLRYLEWTWDPDPGDTTYLVEYAYIMREGTAPARVEHDRHTEGLFPRADWIRWLREAGFHPSIVPTSWSGADPGTHEVFVCTHPGLGTD